ncbi:hypothetical protein FB562_1863 [Homoserinimonas aerilata]|uniref:Uncharacterized protein n=1 Tax=Homoserinimonas aerilata TaxID=1162970 RepID=A0A542YKY9_9MICO|nr:hypothetical protein [Homoserinimonas aerilata]TQL48759.1 hypothetical protein FB562_1863 [Homoserinimonas aerilata]
MEGLRLRVRRDGDEPPTDRAVFDDDNVANRMSYDQRTGIRALVVAIFDQAGNRPQQLEIELARAGERCQGLVSARVELSENAVKNRFGPYIAVLRVVFDDLSVEYLQSVLTLRFSYE